MRHEIQIPHRSYCYTSEHVIWDDVNLLLGRRFPSLGWKPRLIEDVSHWILRKWWTLKLNIEWFIKIKEHNHQPVVVIVVVLVVLRKRPRNKHVTTKTTEANMYFIFFLNRSLNEGENHRQNSAVDPVWVSLSSIMLLSVQNCSN